MKIILKERIENLGSLGDIIIVKSGYARNFLIPYSKAVQATKENIHPQDNMTRHIGFFINGLSRIR